jgi:hypothetical protein
LQASSRAAANNPVSAMFFTALLQSLARQTPHGSIVRCALPCVRSPNKIFGCESVAEAFGGLLQVLVNQGTDVA